MSGFEVVQGEALDVLSGFVDESVHLVVTSPPYFGLRDYQSGTWVGGKLDCDHTYNHGVQGETGQRADRAFTAQAVFTATFVAGAEPHVQNRQLGLEKTLDEYVERLVGILRAVKRVLRSDGTAFVNIGDSYNAHPGQRKTTDSAGPKQLTNKGAQGAPSRHIQNIKAKDLCLIPWRLALALQADGWWLRDIVCWHKPAPMPVSVTDRCTPAWEPILMLAKSARYYFDQDAIREPFADARGGRDGGKQPSERNRDGRDDGFTKPNGIDPSANGGKNKRNVWRIPPMPVNDLHFATYPLELPETCILAGTSERGVCPECGAPWTRLTEKTTELRSNAARAGTEIQGKGTANGQDREDHDVRDGPTPIVRTIGWQPGCSHNLDPVPATVCDPFSGSGTTGLAALKHGRNYRGIELNPDYIAISYERARRHFPLFVGDPPTIVRE